MHKIAYKRRFIASRASRKRIKWNRRARSLLVFPWDLRDIFPARRVTQYVDQRACRRGADCRIKELCAVEYVSKLQTPGTSARAVEDCARLSASWTENRSVWEATRRQCTAHRGHGHGSRHLSTTLQLWEFFKCLVSCALGKQKAPFGTTRADWNWKARSRVSFIAEFNYS